MIGIWKRICQPPWLSQPPAMHRHGRRSCLSDCAYFPGNRVLLQMTLHRSAQYLQANLHHHSKRLEEKAERSTGMTEECCRTNTLISRTAASYSDGRRVRIHHISIIRVEGIGSLLLLRCNSSSLSDTLYFGILTC